MAAPGAYAERAITLTFQLGTGAFGDGTANKVTIAGLRCLIQIAQATLPSPGWADIRVFGLTKDQINTLTKAGLFFYQRKNYVAVQVGDKGKQLTTIFNGAIYEAYPEFSQAPNTAFVIRANAGAVIQLEPAKPVSFPGPIPVASALQQIIKPAGLTLENNGVKTVLASPYFAGTVWQQILTALKAANVYGYHDAISNKLAIWPKNGNRASGSTPIISAETGMIGYPEFMQTRIKVRTLFDPLFAGLAPGIHVQVKSVFTAATGKWDIYNVDYNISSETPGGPWEMIITASPSVGAVAAAA